MKTLNIAINGMSCNGCVNKIKNNFEDFDGVESIDISLDDKMAVIVLDDAISNMKIRNDIIDLGFEVESIKKV